MGQELSKIALFDPVMAIRKSETAHKQMHSLKSLFLDFNTKGPNVGQIIVFVMRVSLIGEIPVHTICLNILFLLHKI